MQVYTLGALVSLQLLDAAAFEDEDYEMDVVSGHVTPDLDGVLYRNVREGVARFAWARNMVSL
jgi:carotenoid cleavage dioxygenase-like enzyme